MPDAATEYFSLTELRNRPDMNPTTYPDEALTAARGWITGIVERWCRTSFVPRTFEERISRSQYNALEQTIVLRKPWLLSVTAVTVGGVALSSDDLALVDAPRNGVLRRYLTGRTDPVAWGGWPIIIGGTAGYTDTPPVDLKEAMIDAARYKVLSAKGESGIPSRALSITNEFGNIAYAQPNNTNRPVGIPDVDAVIVGWADRVQVPGAA